MPYTGAQAAACYAQTSACVKAGLNPAWKCNDNYDQKYQVSSQTTIQSGGYTTRCGGPLQAAAAGHGKPLSAPKVPPEKFYPATHPNPKYKPAAQKKKPVVIF